MKSTEEKTKKQYAMIQVTSEVHELVKEYCNQNGFKIGSLVSILIRKHIKNKK
jgi:hypothetical protein